jgi:hypothetical protein
VTARCENCGTDLAGAYCHACGQRAHEWDELTVRHALRTAADDVLHLESKTLRSMALLFRPGYLTAAYLSGHRIAFTSPIKLYLACAAITFLLAPFTGMTLEQIVAGDPSGQLAQLVEAEVDARGITRASFAQQFDARFQNVYTASLSASILAGAAVLALLFRGARQPFGAHVIYQLHYVSYLYLATTMMAALLLALPRRAWTGPALAMAVIVPYQYLALRRVYRNRGWRLLLKTMAMLVFALFFDSAISYLAVRITAWTI